MPDSLQGYLPGAGLHVVGPVASALLATQSVSALLLHVPLAAQIGDTLLLRQAVALQQLLLLASSRPRLLDSSFTSRPGKAAASAGQQE